MTVLVLTLVVFVAAILGLAAGLLLGRGPLKGSCGGHPLVRVCALCRPKASR